MKRLLAIGILLAVPTTAWSWQENNTARQWTDHTGQHSVRATLVTYDPQSKVVVLQREDGTELKLDAVKLCEADRKLLARRAERERIRRNRDDQQVSTGSPAIDEALADSPFDEDRDRPPTRRNRRTDTERLYGISWHRNPQSARTAATGNAGNSDDRPVIWFRVLGDLDGFM